MKTLSCLRGIIILLFISNFAVSQENFNWNKTDSVNKSKDKIYSDTKLFISNTWNSAKDVIQNDDKEAGVILLKGNIIKKVNYNMGEYVYVYNYTLTFKMKDKKYKVELNNVYCNDARMTGSKFSIVKIEPFDGDNCPPTGTMSAMGLPKKKAIPMMAEVKQELQSIIDSYEKNIKLITKDEW
jgi:hypothetical protein